jgi:hypothetical protein
MARATQKRWRKAGKAVCIEKKQRRGGKKGD